MAATEEKATLQNIQAILEFLDSLDHDVKELITAFSTLEELEKERIVAQKNLLQTNLETQGKALDKILVNYSFLQDDVDINGERLKKIAKQFLRHADELGLTDIVREKKKNTAWQFYR